MNSFYYSIKLQLIENRILKNVMLNIIRNLEEKIVRSVVYLSTFVTTT